jgi:hypothetical protein
MKREASRMIIRGRWVVPRVLGLSPPLTLSEVLA